MKYISNRKLYFNKWEMIWTILLFLLYINDFPNISDVFDFYLFADDTNIDMNLTRYAMLKIIKNCTLTLTMVEC